MQDIAAVVAGIVDRLPESDTPKQPSKFTGPEPAQGWALIAELLKGGRDAIVALVGQVGDQSNYKPGYALHCAAVAVGAPGKEAERRMFAETLAAELASEKHSKQLKAFLIRELQVAGGPEVVEALGKHLLDDDLCEPATQALIAIEEGAAAQLYAALPQATGKKRMTIAQALGVLKAPPSVAALRQVAESGERDERIAATWALASIADASACDVVAKAATSGEGWERIQAAKACLVMAERLAAAGDKGKATRLLNLLKGAMSDPDEDYVREAARKALERLGA